MTVGHHPMRLFHQPLLHHLLHALVDAAVERLAFAAQTHLDDAKGALLDRCRAETAVGTPRHVADLQRMDDALGVLQVHGAVVVGVEQTQLVAEAVESFSLVAVEQRAARLLIHGGDVVNPLADGIDVHHRTAGEQHGVVGGEEIVEQLQHLLFVAGGAVVVRELQGAHQVVLDAGQLLGGGGSSANGQVGIELP